VSYTGGAIGFFLALALFALAALIPYGVAFSVSASKMLDVIERRRKAGVPVGAKETLVAVAQQYQILYDSNRPKIRALLWCFRIATLCLIAEVVLWIYVLKRGKL
jgi:hypothetical protein